LLYHVVQQSKTSRGVKHKKVYTLTPMAFKKCLMRAKNCDIYSDYYILLEKIYIYYTDYENKYKNRILSMKDDKIDKLLEETKEQSAKMDKQSAKMDKQSAKMDKQSVKLDKQSLEIRELLGYAEETKEDNTELKKDVKDLHGKVDILLKERVVPLSDNKLDTYLLFFRVLNHDEIDITSMRCQQRSLPNAIKKLEIKYGIDNIELIFRVHEPNSINSFNHIRERMRNTVQISRNSIKLIDTDSECFINEVYHICQEKFDI
jgi:hypothetical protein